MQKSEMDESEANDCVEYCYNILLFKIRSIMFENGYVSSGQGAHEAEVAYSRTLSLTEAELRFLDQLRYFRNGILYYGKKFDKEYAQKVVGFTRKVFQKLQ